MTSLATRDGSFHNRSVQVGIDCTLLFRSSFAAAAVFLALSLGLFVTVAPQVAFVFVLGLLGITALAAPSSIWIGAALIATVSFKGLTTFGVLPAVATFADIFLVWGGIAAAGLRAMSRRGRADPRARRLMLCLTALGLSAAVSALFARTELARPVVYVLLLGLPFALITALLLDPPTADARRVLGRLIVAVALIQIPFAASQFVRGAKPDDVQGTLIGAGAGAHVMSAIAVLGALWLIVGSGPRSLRFPLAAVLLVLPFIADAKQVIFAAPAMLLAGNWRGGRDILLRGGVVAAALAILLLFVPAGTTADRFLESNAAGKGGKQATAELVLDEMQADYMTNLLFGLGPAESVSRAAFMTTPLLLHSDSPLQVLGLGPARLPGRAEFAARNASGGGTSLNSGVSSALGVFGDLGMIGLLFYLAMPASLWLMLRHGSTPKSAAATCALAVYLVLGLVFDWWEQPPFTLMMALMVALALITPSEAGKGVMRRGVPNP